MPRAWDQEIYWGGKMGKTGLILAVVGIIGAMAMAAPASATVACTVTIGSVINPVTHTASVEPLTSCLGGSSFGTAAAIPSPVFAITSFAPPDSQFYKFSATSASLTMSFVSPSEFDGTLSLFTEADALVNGGTAAIGDGFGTLGVSGLTIGSNYILDVEYDTTVDPTTAVFFSAAIDPPTTQSVPEPLTLSLFSAGLVGATVMRRRKKG